MAAEPHFKDDEQREIARGGKSTAAWTLGLAVVVIGGGLVLATLLRERVGPPARPGTTSGTTTAGETKPPSPQ